MASEELVLEPDLAGDPLQAIDPPVRARSPAVLLEAAVGEQATDVGVLAAIGTPGAQDVRYARPRHVDEAPLLERQEERRVLVARTEVRQRRPPHAADQLAGHRRIVDLARVDGAPVRLEQVAPFLEERAPLREEQREGRVRVDLGDVGLYLAEIGVERGLGGESDRERVAQTERRLGVRIIVAEVAGRIVEVLPRTGGRRRDGREELQRATRTNAPNPRQGPPLAGEALLAAGRRRPCVLVAAVARPRAPERGPPDLLGPVGEAQALERHRHLDDVAVIGDRALALVDDVEAVVLAGGLREARVALHSRGVGKQVVGPGGVPVGVEQDPEVVVLPDLVAVADAGPERGGVVVGDESQVEVPLVVGDQDLALHRRAGADVGVVLGETRRARRVGPARVVERAVDLDRPGAAGGLGEVVLANIVAIFLIRAVAKNLDA